MQIKGWILGSVDMEITSADINRVINRIINEGIPLSNIKWLDELTVQITIFKRDYRKVLAISNSYQCDLKLLKKSGISVFGARAAQRPILIIGMFLYLLASIWIPRHIFFVQVTGNESVSAKEIIEQADSCGLFFGSSRKAVRSEQLKNKLLEKIPQLQWVGINTSGCVATISVKERTDRSESPSKSIEPSSIVASKDGVIRSVTASRGSVSCQVGQAVTEGQTLISGYTDCGAAIVFTRAEGEVYADTNTDLEVVTLNYSIDRSNVLRSRTRYSVIFGKKLIKLYKDSGILDTTCVKIYEEYNICLPGGFTLPLKIAAETIEYYDVSNQTDDRLDCPWLLNRGNEYLNSQMIAGQIIGRDSVFFSNESVCGYSLKYSCNEMIGQIKKEEIFDLHGKNS